MAAVKIAVCGAAGRMGRNVIDAILSRNDTELAGVIEYSQNPLIGQEIGAIIGRPEIKLPLAPSLSEGVGDASVYIDFTTVEASLSYLEEAVKLNLAAVIGSTGTSPAKQKAVEEAAKKIPVLWAPNMSTGISVMYKIAAAMTKMLGPDFDLEIVESHHNQKKDSPSGTALKLFETVAKARGLDPEKSLLTGRQGLVGERGKDEIGVLALRGGDIVGEHTLYFCGQGERLELSHRASNRTVFSQGAVRAAAWLAGKKPGLYSIEDTISVEGL